MPGPGERSSGPLCAVKRPLESYLPEAQSQKPLVICEGSKCAGTRLPRVLPRPPRLPRPKTALPTDRGLLPGQSPRGIRRQPEGSGRRIETTGPQPVCRLSGIDQPLRAQRPRAHAGRGLPDRYARFVTDLFEDGVAKLGTITIQPSNWCAISKCGPGEVRLLPPIGFPWPASGTPKTASFASFAQGQRAESGRGIPCLPNRQMVQGPRLPEGRQPGQAGRGVSTTRRSSWRSTTTSTSVSRPPTDQRQYPGGTGGTDRIFKNSRPLGHVDEPDQNHARSGFASRRQRVREARESARRGAAEHEGETSVSRCIPGVTSDGRCPPRPATTRRSP